MHAHRLVRRNGADAPKRAGGGRLRSLVSLVTALLLACAGFVVATGTAAAAADDNTVATWNMNQNPDDWEGAYNMARTTNVVALQEVPIRVPAGAYRQPDVNGVEHYLWVRGQDHGPLRHLYILRPGGHQRNLGMITTWEPEDVRNLSSVNRPALAVLRRPDNIMFAAVHAESGSGNDVGALLRRIEFAAARSNVGRWAAIGDFNREPDTLDQLDNLPAYMHIYNPGDPTHRTNGSEYDYMIANFTTDRWQATVDSNRASDHWPVYFGALRAAAGPTPFSIEPHNSHLLLRVNSNTPANGTHVYQSRDNYDLDGRWILRDMNRTTPLGQEVYRIQSATPSHLCLDVDHGQQSHVDDYLNISVCHGDNGQPYPGGYLRDTQNFTLDHPNPRFPNLTMLRDNGTGMYASILGDSADDGAGVVQDFYRSSHWPYPTDSEAFYLHPTPTTIP